MSHSAASSSYCVNTRYSPRLQAYYLFIPNKEGDPSQPCPDCMIPLTDIPLVSSRTFSFSPSLSRMTASQPAKVVALPLVVSVVSVNSVEGGDGVTVRAVLTSRANREMYELSVRRGSTP